MSYLCDEIPNNWSSEPAETRRWPIVYTNQRIHYLLQSSIWFSGILHLEFSKTRTEESGTKSLWFCFRKASKKSASGKSLRRPYNRTIGRRLLRVFTLSLHQVRNPLVVLTFQSRLWNSTQWRSFHCDHLWRHARQTRQDSQLSPMRHEWFNRAE